MKKLFTFIVLLVFMSPVFSQQIDERVYDLNSRSPLLEGMVKAKDLCGDFTITDSDGVTWNLYDMLDEGRTVFLDLFFTT